MSDATYEAIKEKLNAAKQQMFDAVREHMTSSEMEEFRTYMDIVMERTLTKYKVSAF